MYQTGDFHNSDIIYKSILSVLHEWVETLGLTIQYYCPNIVMVYSLSILLQLISPRKTIQPKKTRLEIHRKIQVGAVGFMLFLSLPFSEPERISSHTKVGIDM